MTYVGNVSLNPVRKHVAARTGAGGSFRSVRLHCDRTVYTVRADRTASGDKLLSFRAAAAAAAEGTGGGPLSSARAHSVIRAAFFSHYRFGGGGSSWHAHAAAPVRNCQTPSRYRSHRPCLLSGACVSSCVRVRVCLCARVPVSPW